jgi:predicted methyltransferase
MRAGRLDDLAMHPTVKPVALVADAIQDCTRRSDIVLDPCGGSGTTLIAAEKTGAAGAADRNRSNLCRCHDPQVAKTEG